MRSITEIGAMWPLCKCGHIAQEHDADEKCGARKRSQCSACGTHNVDIPCNCTGYTGPTLEEFKTRLAPEEIAYYKF